ncbi:hypothetical protein [Pseudomonas fluorescens]|jgi:hypothetical protein|uniref:hypothetical protein n=1 Tax=Pseudomonas fluorescens TaxID=294 RepID=UPI001CA68AEB|nr:hypothetical protein [Pseudomonas fluorescens]MBY8934558.1 hypothetical protein [Pseudomonas fluorescens]
MWVTQTYLGAVEPEAKLFVYYFFLDYIEEQKEFTELVQIELEKLGEVFGDNVCLLMPNPKYTGRIEAEIRDNQPLWQSVRSKLPGLFISKDPLSKFDAESGDNYFVPFKGQNTKDIRAAAQTIRELSDKTICWYFQKKDTSITSKSLATRINDSIELKPGIFGIRIDLKKLFNRS